MPQKEVLGPEWGSLAGLPAEEALKYVAQYAADLEADKERSSQSGGEPGDEPEDSGSPKVPNSLNIARDLNRQSKAPLQAEFVGKRDSARRQARRHIEGLGYDWNDVEDVVEDAMSQVDADQQTNPQAWVAAFVYAYGQADVARRVNGQSDGGDDPTPPRPEYDDVRVRDMSGGDRGNRVPVDDSSRNKITDPVEQNTKRQFEKVLGKRIPDAEWIALQDPDMIKTEEDWKEFQAQQDRRNT